VARQDFTTTSGAKLHACVPSEFEDGARWASRYLIKQPDAPDPLRGSISSARERKFRVGDLIQAGGRRPRPLTWWRVEAIEPSPVEGWDGLLRCAFADPMPLDLEREAAVWLP
jgi:hypothetical protein